MALRVLLADESTTIKKVMQLALQDFAVEVKSVQSGVDVAEVARTFEPDIIFADVLLQKKNGYEVCTELKKSPALKTIPVVLMWSSFMDLDERQATASGADRRLEKPFDVENLRQLVLELVPKTRTQKLAHFLKFPESISEPMKHEVSDRKGPGMQPPPVALKPPLPPRSFTPSAPPSFSTSQPAPTSATLPPWATAPPGVTPVAKAKPLPSWVTAPRVSPPLPPPPPVKVASADPDEDFDSFEDLSSQPQEHSAQVPERASEKSPEKVPEKIPERPREKSPEPPSPMDFDKVEAKKDPPASRWGIDSFDDIPDVSTADAPSIVRERDDEEFAEFRIASITKPPERQHVRRRHRNDDDDDEASASEVTVVTSGAVDDRDPWSHQDLQRFRLDLAPATVDHEDLEVHVDLKESADFGMSQVGVMPLRQMPVDDAYILDDVDLDAVPGMEIDEHTSRAVDENEFDLQTPRSKRKLELTPFEEGSQTATERLSDRPAVNYGLGRKAAHEEEVSPVKGAHVPQLSPDRLEEIIRSQSREIIESVVRKLVPDLASQLIREELNRLLEDSVVGEASLTRDPSPRDAPRATQRDKPK